MPRGARGAGLIHNSARMAARLPALVHVDHVRAEELNGHTLGRPLAAALPPTETSLKQVPGDEACC
jgi:hypothetical protein